ncbi:LysR family transcriptional regulator [Dactylosporangium aurantiacum]|uniref:LysR family transcriptional regulator n=1 Tax=Dactylosporangium aurantiacum TaxID=35754 RepID=A0A9Q9I6K3_9ACTN|nr:LysR family transcriptional regulator [Dactylosporangium aurantiacum]MDG6106379.1 LysR family transcriptional regulator [Dactylosporangium aurantiacum]UWZ50579.1 LysR family transcriptional regulator [Dactylosporangium aurantiacum]
MDTLELRELRYFVAVAEELHFGRAARRLGIAQPPLSRAVRQLERRIGVTLLDRDRHGVALTAAGGVLLDEARAILDATAAAARRTRRAAAATGRLILATKAGANHELLRKLLDAHAAEPDAAAVEVVLCGLGEQARMLRDGRADVALMQRPFDALTGFDTEDLLTEQQIAILPAGHPLAARPALSMADISDLPDLPLARWPRPDGTYAPGPGPQIRDQSQLAQLIALGHTAAVLCASSRAWLWNAHAAVPLTDAPHVTTVLAWPAHSRSLAVAGLARTAARL